MSKMWKASNILANYPTFPSFLPPPPLTDGCGFVPQKLDIAPLPVAETFGDYISKFSHFGGYISYFGQINLILVT